MTTLEILIAARKLIEKPENWTQRNFARDRQGTPIIPHDDRAVCFCSDGALRRAITSSDFSKHYLSAFDALAHQCGGDPISFNDTHTHAEVLTVFDRAIEAARAQVQG